MDMGKGGGEEGCKNTFILTFILTFSLRKEKKSISCKDIGTQRYSRYSLGFKQSQSTGIKGASELNKPHHEPQLGRVSSPHLSRTAEMPAVSAEYRKEQKRKDADTDTTDIQRESTSLFVPSTSTRRITCDKPDSGELHAMRKMPEVSTSPLPRRRKMELGSNTCCKAVKKQHSGHF